MNEAKDMNGNTLFVSDLVECPDKRVGVIEVIEGVSCYVRRDNYNGVGSSVENTLFKGEELKRL